MNNLKSNTKDLKKAKKEFKKLRKISLIEIIIELQELILGYKAKIVELERMLDERGLVIEELRESSRRCQKCEYNKKNTTIVERMPVEESKRINYFNLLCKKL